MRRLVILEDEPLLLASLSRYFADSGYSVEGAKDLERAGELLNAPFDALIVDLRFTRGGLEGLDLLRTARKAAPAAPLILLTGLAGPEAERGREAGADAVLEKPVRLPALEALLQSIFDRRG